jgi:hypothetical protein
MPDGGGPVDANGNAPILTTVKIRLFSEQFDMDF